MGDFAARLQSIREHPERHKHDFGGMLACCMVGGALDVALVDAHPQLGTNGGQKCDVWEGPCSCGAWHIADEPMPAAPPPAPGGTDAI